MRTVTVVGPAEIEKNGHVQKTVKITDQPTANAEAVIFWVDEKGRVLRSRAPDGLVSVSATAQDVLRTYPRARRLISRMHQAERGQPEQKRRNHSEGN